MQCQRLTRRIWNRQPRLQIFLAYLKRVGAVSAPASQVLSLVWRTSSEVHHHQGHSGMARGRRKSHTSESSRKPNATRTHMLPWRMVADLHAKRLAENMVVSPQEFTNSSEQVKSIGTVFSHARLSTTLPQGVCMPHVVRAQRKGR